MAVKPPHKQEELEKELNENGSFTDEFTEEDHKNMTFQMNRMQDAQQNRDTPHQELNNRTYYQYFNSNERVANTFVDKSKKKSRSSSTEISAGTIESKMWSLASNLNNANLSPEVTAYSKDNTMLSQFSQAIEDTINMTRELEEDDEKQIWRMLELLKQGTVFIHEGWHSPTTIKKTLKKKKYNGEFKVDKSDLWTERFSEAIEYPESQLLYGPSVYLGDISEPDMDKQPYVFTVRVTDYNVAESELGKFEMFQKYVRPGDRSASAESQMGYNNTLYHATFNVVNTQDNKVEIVHYYDPYNDEFQIYANGVPMLPYGFPLSAVSPGGKIPIAKQILYPLSHKFAYGGSFVSSGDVKMISDLIDEMLKLFVQKTRKSVNPPYLNTTGQFVSPKVLEPGRISMGVDPDAFQPIGQEGSGVTASEFNVLRELQSRVDQSTVSPVFTGNQTKAGTTATEVVELQRQAKLSLGIIMSMATLMEKKMIDLRVPNLMQNWFFARDMRDTTIQDVRGGLTRLSERKVTREASIPGKGQGERQIIPARSNEVPAPDEVAAMQDMEERERGMPIQKIFIDIDNLVSWKLWFFTTAQPEEKDTSAVQQVRFREQLTNMLPLLQMGSKPNLEELESEFARTHGVKRGKFFKTGSGQGQLGDVSEALQQALAQGGRSSSASAGQPGQQAEQGESLGELA